MEFKYDSIYTTTMFIVSAKLDELDSTCIELSFQHDARTQHEFICKAKKLCRDVITGYDECATVSRRMLDARIPQGKGVTSYVRTVYKSLKEASEELLQERFERSIDKLETLTNKLSKKKESEKIDFNELDEH